MAQSTSSQVSPNRFRDFDAAIEEAQQDPVRLKVAGREYVLPPSLPASVVLLQMRNITDEGVIPTKAIPEWMDALVGAEHLKQMLDDGLTWKQLEEVTQYLLTEYGVIGASTITEDGEGNPQ